MMAMSVGFLAPPFALIAQDLGAKETLLKSPIDTARVDFVISKIIGFNQFGSVFKNHITKCSFHSDDDIGPGGAIICKLTDGHKQANGFGNIVAEGRLDLKRTYTHSVTTYIKINNVAYKNANDVQNIFDVKIVVLGTNPTCDFINGPNAQGVNLPDCK